MTQLVKKDSSWRTLRRKAVVGASSFALVAGMGVALAPSAAAAGTTVKAEFSAANVLNDGSDSVNLVLTVDNSTNSAAVTPIGGTLTVTVPAGLDCLTTGDLTAIGGNPVLNVGTGTQPDATKTNICEYPVVFDSNGVTAPNPDNTIAAATTATATFAVVVDGQSVLPWKTGTVGVSLQVNGSTGAIGSSSASVNVVNASAPSFNDPVAATLGSAYNAKLVKDFGYNGSTASTLVVQGVQNPVVATKTSADVTRPGGSSNPAITVGSKDYVSLNTADTIAEAGSTATNATQTGFFLEMKSGNVIYGTLSSTWNTVTSVADNAFAAKVVSTPQAVAYTWIAVANNGAGGASAGADAGLAKLTLGPNDVASKPFTFTVNAAFTDVAATNVFRDAINALTGMGVINGTTPTTFNPAGKVTRGEFAAMAGRLLGKIDSSLSGGSGACDASAIQVFTDVANSNVFCKEITYLAAFGVVKGTSATTFEPNAPVTRDQIATFVYRLSLVIDGSPVADKAPADSAVFSDVKATQPLSGNVTWANSTDPKIVEGFEGGLFKPADNAQRDQAAAFLYRFYQVES